MRKFLMPIWSNGICAMIADKAEISDSRDTLSVPVNDPRSIFGEQVYPNKINIHKIIVFLGF